MIELCTTGDIGNIDDIFTRDGVYKKISDDRSPEVGKFTVMHVIARPEFIFLKVVDDTRTIGIFLLRMLNGLTLEVHTTFLPGTSGKAILQGMKDGIQWVFEKTPYRKIISYIPADNRPAYVMAISAGCHKEGTVTKSFQRDGKIMDQYIVGIEKEG